MAEDPDLAELERAFDAGDYRAVREGTARIARDEKTSEDVKKAARELRARTEPSRAQLALLVVAALLVIALSGYEIARHNPGAQTPEGPRPRVERLK